MSDSKLETFKVGDKHKPRVKSSAKPQGKAEPESAAAPTLGFARIEAILDQEDPTVVQKSLARLVEALDRAANEAKSQKDRGQAKRAKAAVERTTDLLTYLFETKDSMLRALAEPAKGPDEGKSKRSVARKGDK